MRLANLVEIAHNDMTSVVLKVKENKEMELICLGYFTGDETMFRLTKGDDHTCTVWRKDGTHFSWHWGNSGVTCVTDDTRKKGNLIEACITDDFGIIIQGKGMENTLYTVVPEVFEDEFKVMYYPEGRRDYCIHKNGNYWRHFDSFLAFKNYLYELGYDEPVKVLTETAKTGCTVEHWKANRH